MASGSGPRIDVESIAGAVASGIQQALQQQQQQQLAVASSPLGLPRYVVDICLIVLS